MDNKLYPRLTWATKQSLISSATVLAFALLWNFGCSFYWNKNGEFNSVLHLMLWVICGYAAVGMSFLNFLVFLHPNLKWFFGGLGILVAIQFYTESLLYVTLLVLSAFNISCVFVQLYLGEKKG